MFFNPFPLILTVFYKFYRRAAFDLFFKKSLSEFFAQKNSFVFSKICIKLFFAVKTDAVASCKPAYETQNPLFVRRFPAGIKRGPVLCRLCRKGSTSYF